MSAPSNGAGARGVAGHRLSDRVWWPWVRALGSLVLGMALAIVGIGYGVLAQTHMQSPTQNDFYSFYGSAQRVLRGESPYWPVQRHPAPGHPCHRHSPEQLEAISLPAGQADAQLELMCRPPNLNPPFFSLLLAPLALLGADRANLVWVLASVLSVGVSVGCVVRQLRARGRPPMGPLPFLALLALLFLWFPTMANVLFGQVTLVLTLPLVLAWVALRQGRQGWAGFWLGGLISVKVFFGLFVLSLALTRQWRALVVAGLTALTAAGMGLWPAGWAGYADYLEGLRQVDWLGVNWNGSVAGFAHRLLGGANSVSWVAWPLGAQALKGLLSLAVVVALVWPLHRAALHGDAPHHSHPAPSAPDRQAALADVLFALTVPAMLLLSPLGWMYYFTWLLLPAALVWRWAAFTDRPHWVRWAVVNLALMSALPRDYTGATATDVSLLACLLDWGFYTYTLAGLLVLAWVLSRRVAVAS